MNPWVWFGFGVLIVSMLAIDLGVFHRHAHVVRTREALVWTFIWIGVSLAFNAGVYFIYENNLESANTPEAAQAADADGGEAALLLSGKDAAIEFFTAYVIEKSLSLDNIFVIALIFGYFRVPGAVQHRVLFWGVIGAIIMRGVMIAAGTALIHRFSWMPYVFGAILIATAVKLLIARHDNLEPDRNPLVRLARKWYPVSADYEGAKFLTRVDGRRAVTPLMLVLIVVESTDLLFAVDSIPAVFAVTLDPFLVFTSNVFAILGLRSLYFALAGMMDRFRFLKASLVFVLAFVGVKMMLAHHHPIPTWVSLVMILGILSVGVLASLLGARRDTAPLASPIQDARDDPGKTSV